MLKTHIHKVEVTNGQSYLSFEVRLPGNTGQLESLMVTTSLNDLSFLKRLGTLSLQSNERTDIFFQGDIYQDGYSFHEPFENGFDEMNGFGHIEFVTGKRPGKHSINVDGSTGNLSGWFRSYYTSDTDFTVTIYIMYREAGL